MSDFLPSKQPDSDECSSERLFDDIRVVSPKVAMAILDEGNSLFYEKTIHELETYKVGSSRKITLRSIKKRQERLLEQQRQRGTA